MQPTPPPRAARRAARRWTEQRLAAPPAGAFARFVAALWPGVAGRRLMLACVLLSELEGRGHSCLMLDELAADPAALLGWRDGA